MVKVGGGAGTSTWTHSGDLYVGYNGTGTLEITGGGSVSNSTGFIGRQPIGNGTVTVGGGTGIASWTNSGTLHVGFNGKGKLNINTGGLVIALALGGGAPMSSVDFDGGTIRITGSDSASNTINLLTSGGTIDVLNAATNFTITSPIGGSGGLTKTGSGTLTLSASISILVQQTLMAEL